MSMRDDRWVDTEIEQAIARGDFDDLPGAGKPLRLPDTHDPDWWIRQRLDEDDVDRDALLPVVVLLRREHDRRDETLAALLDEQAVREYAEDFTARVREDRAANPLARMLAPELDPEVAVERWRTLRAERDRADESVGPAASALSETSAAEHRPGFWRRLLGRGRR
ncbi:DnaJ family domain-containing protein [Brachybacterium sp. DNPG3]